MQLTSDSFAHQSPIPDTFTCKGQSTSPSLRIADIPPGTKSLVLVLHDPDAPNGDFLHWTVWNIPPTTFLFKENSVPDSAVQGVNDFGKVGYGSPCPPSGTHRYVFELYALNILLDLPEGSPPRVTYKRLWNRMCSKRPASPAL